MASACLLKASMVNFFAISVIILGILDYINIRAE